jgi:hypothetical protein
MSTVKISQLPLIPQLNANTANTLFVGVDVPTAQTGRLTITTLAQGLYSNNILNVGLNPVVLLNTLAQFSGNDPTYLQVNLQNFNGTGSGDFVITADTGSNTTSYLDLGINNSQYTGNNAGYTAFNSFDGYLYVHGPTDTSYQGNLVIGTASANANIVFMVGNTFTQNIVGYVTNKNFTFNKPLVVNANVSTSNVYIFADGTTQSTAAVAGDFARASANVANAGFIQANAAFVQANAGNSLATSAYYNANQAFIQANAAFANSNTSIAYLYGVNVTQNTTLTYLQSVNNYQNTIDTYVSGVDAGQNTFALAAFNTANSALQNTTGTFAGSLTTTGNVTTQILYPNQISFLANAIIKTGTASGGNKDFFITAGDDLSTSNGGNITITSGRGGSVSGGGGNITLNAGTSNTAGANGNITLNGNVAFNNYFTTNLIPSISNTFQIGSVTNRIGSLWLGANTIHMLDQITGYDATISVSNTVLQVNNTAAFIVGNVAIYANGTIVAPAVTVQGSLRVNNSTFSSTTSAVRIDGSTGGLAQQTTQDGTMVQIIGKDNLPTRILVDSTSLAGNAYGLIAGRSARGNVAYPLAAQAGDVLMRFAGNGYGTSNYSPLGVARMDIIAAENYSDTNKGSVINFTVTPVGSNVLVQNIVSISANTTTFANTITPVKGIINTVRQYSGAQTAITVNFTTDSIVYCTISAALTITPANFVAGKTLEVWVTNTATGNRTVTHGITPLNSTMGATGFTLAGTQTAKILYTCLDGTLANTLVAVISSGV